MNLEKKTLLNIGAGILSFGLIAWLGISFYIYTQASTLIYEEEKSETFEFKKEFEQDFVMDSSGNKIDLITVTKPGSQVWFLYLHGTWGRLPYIIEGLNKEGNVLSVSYPGFSKSTGVANTDNINEAAELGLKFLNKKGVPKAKTIVVGHSLGGSPSLYLASKHPDLRRVIVINSFYSMKAMCEEKFPGLCIFAGNVHPSNNYALKAQAGITLYHNPNDESIPYAQGEKLNAIISSEHTFYPISGDHGNFPVEELFKHEY